MNSSVSWMLFRATTRSAWSPTIRKRQGTYCYRVMPFGLKNAEATYQRLVNKMFQKKIGASMEVYIDDMLVKSTIVGLHITHLSEAFQILRAYNVKLNPAKCAFGVSTGKFLGFIVNYRGIEANPDKIKAVLDMPPPFNIKEVQRLIRRIAALSRLVSKASDKCQPFFQVLKKAFQWDTRCEEAFSALKTYLSSPPILVSPSEESSLLCIWECQISRLAPSSSETKTEYNILSTNAAEL